MMHIVLSGYFGFHNTGDEAILYSMIEQLKRIQPNIRITALSNDPLHTSTTYDIESVNRWSLPAIFRVIKSADGVISGGGSLLQDATGPRSIIYYTSVINIARLLKKPVFVYSQGMGPIEKRFGKLLTTFTLNHVDRLTVRDEDSKKLLESMNIRHDIDIVPDPVLGMKVPEEPSKWLLEQQIDEPIVAISVRPWKTEKYLDKIADAADRLRTDGYTILFVPMHGEGDEKSSKEVLKRMREEAFILPADCTIQEKLKVVSESELLIGMRLHSLIFAAVSAVPFIPLSYDPKIASFAALYDVGPIFHVEHDTWDGDLLYQEVKNIEENRERIMKNSQQLTETYQSQTERTAAEALEAFSS
ncbi:polysaccharide pyruvyl transferase CsaB [Halobacillus yeomjeoni]|uniref:polysaccharide pyruvyl transferase CsaB n=1 Tax=Halobacillus yeomjeoni TaxID=311194 RepID=UPI001CD70470|nr:polysaccharide pyruvyl transferase CsaB [Halobacillus yeomjeoni]MCA0985207.1 polysaccharide pyruvyl transferase CsaB [Halobacillus yeomjeoni]